MLVWDYFVVTFSMFHCATTSLNVQVWWSMVKIENMNQLFGQLRSELAQIPRAFPKNCEWGERLLNLSKTAFELDEYTWNDQWAHYLENVLVNVGFYALVLSDLDTLRRAHKLLPGACFKLDLKWALLVSNNIREIAECECMLSVNSLDLSHNNLSGDEICNLLSSRYLVNLKDLSLSGNELDPDSIRAIFNTGRFPSLDRLDLSKNAIGSDGIKEIAHSVHLSTLLDLDLTCADIEDRSVETLADSRCFLS